VLRFGSACPADHHVDPIRPASTGDHDPLDEQADDLLTILNGGALRPPGAGHARGEADEFVAFGVSQADGLLFEKLTPLLQADPRPLEMTKKQG
jgi:hypothetical protein